MVVRYIEHLITVSSKPVKEFGYGAVELQFPSATEPANVLEKVGHALNFPLLSLLVPRQYF